MKDYMSEMSSELDRLEQTLKSPTSKNKSTLFGDSVDRLTEGFTPSRKESRNNLSLRNVGAFLDKPIISSKSGLTLELQVLGDGADAILRCAVTSKDKPHPIPLDLWRSRDEEIQLEEVLTGSDGIQQFRINADDLPFLCLSVGTVDGRYSVRGRDILALRESTDLTPVTQYSPPFKPSLADTRGTSVTPETLVHLHGDPGTPVRAKLYLFIWDEEGGDHWCPQVQILTAQARFPTAAEGQVVISLDDQEVAVAPLKELVTDILDTVVLPLAEWRRVIVGYRDSDGKTVWMPFTGVEDLPR